MDNSENVIKDIKMRANLGYWWDTPQMTTARALVEAIEYALAAPDHAHAFRLARAAEDIFNQEARRSSDDEEYKRMDDMYNLFLDLKNGIRWESPNPKTVR